METWLERWRDALTDEPEGQLVGGIAAPIVDRWSAKEKWRRARDPMAQQLLRLLEAKRVIHASKLDSPFPARARSFDGSPNPVALDDRVGQRSETRDAQALTLDEALMACGVDARMRFAEVEEQDGLDGLSGHRRRIQGEGVARFPDVVSRVVS